MASCPIGNALGVCSKTPHSVSAGERVVSLSDLPSKLFLSPSSAKAFADSSSDKILFLATDPKTKLLQDVEFTPCGQVKVRVRKNIDPEWKENQAFQKRLVNILRIGAAGIVVSTLTAVGAVILAMRKNKASQNTLADESPTLPDINLQKVMTSAIK